MHLKCICASQPVSSQLSSWRSNAGLTSPPPKPPPGLDLGGNVVCVSVSNNPVPES